MGVGAEVEILSLSWSDRVRLTRVGIARCGVTVQEEVDGDRAGADKPSAMVNRAATPAAFLHAAGRWWSVCGPFVWGAIGGLARRSTARSGRATWERVVRVGNAKRKPPLLESVRASRARFTTRGFRAIYW